MNEITSAYRYERGSLINYQDKPYPKIQYESELQSDLTFQLQDPVLAKTIAVAYANHIEPMLNDGERGLFTKGLLRVCLLFGTMQYPPTRALYLALKEEGFSTSWTQDHEEAIKHFIEEANQGEFFHQPKPIDELAHIVILTTSSAGGNLAVAEGLENELKRTFRVSVIDVEKVSEEVDPMMLATGTHTFDRIYAQVIQQANRMDEGFDIQLKEFREVARYIEPTLGHKLKEQIKQLRPDFILSTRNGHQLDISLSYGLGLPGSVLHCDCEVGYYYKDLIGKIQPQLFKIWLPDNLPRVFAHVLDLKESKWDEGYQKLLWDDFKPILAASIGVGAQELEEELEFVGAPIRPEIHAIKDAGKIESLRETWGFNPGEQGVLVTMGRNGVGKMKEVFSELLTASSHDRPVKYIFVCGTHQAMKQEFEERLKSADLSESALKSCLIHGLASGKEMNELLNINSMLIGKPGGSQVEECIKARIPMMVVFSHEYWESGGQARLERLGYSLDYNSEESLRDQVEKHLNILEGSKMPKVAGRKWKQLVPQAINRALESSFSANSL